MWHRVRPVKSGVRKSIVGWLLGPVTDNENFKSK